MGERGGKARRWAGVLLLLSLAPGCAHRAATDPEKARTRFQTPEQRIRAFEQASLHAPREIASVDLVAGPDVRKKEHPLPAGAWVRCRFTRAGSEKAGRTDKFDCAILEVRDPETFERLQPREPGKEDEVKVKYGPQNGEVYTEVAASRLLWALGFHADRMYPVRVVCEGCPADPSQPAHPTDNPTATRAYWLAAIERDAKGKRMYEARRGKRQGWSWEELERYSRAPIAHKDGLALMAAFLVHGDNKPEQQRMRCDGVKVDESTEPADVTCKRARLYIQDAGGSFGGGGLRTSNHTAKMNLEHWRATKIWKDSGRATRPDGSSDAVCRARLPRSLSSWWQGGGLSDPEISEEGRRFVADLLAQLSDAQIADLFRVARVDEVPSNRQPAGLDAPDEIIEAWVSAFREKRDDIVRGSCRWSETPAASE